uniref:Uncharacterized protein n=1 Tax=Anopheles coluzzii TaxID=1518534 RepID=A0A8W7PYZ6_ANOCL
MMSPDTGCPMKEHAGTFVKSTAVLASIPMLADLAVRWQQPFSIPPHVPCSKPPDIQQSRKNSHVPPSCWHSIIIFISTIIIIVTIFFAVFATPSVHARLIRSAHLERLRPAALKPIRARCLLLVRYPERTERALQMATVGRPAVDVADVVDAREQLVRYEQVPRRDVPARAPRADLFDAQPQLGIGERAYLGIELVALTGR